MSEDDLTDDGFVQTHITVAPHGIASVSRSVEQAAEEDDEFPGKQKDMLQTQMRDFFRRVPKEGPKSIITKPNAKSRSSKNSSRV